MPEPQTSRTVEERLEKARLMPRVSPDLLTMCQQVDKLLLAQHQSNLGQAIICAQEIARDNPLVVVALKWTISLVDFLESDIADVRLSACNALAAVSMAQEGRDALRSAGGVRPLVMLLAEGSRSDIAAAAALALMNCSACDVCKEAIADCRGVPQLLLLVRDAVGRTGPPPSNTSSAAAGSALAGSGAAAAQPDLRSPGECRAAAYAAGALLNMGGVASVQERMLEAGAVAVFEEAMRVAAAGDVVATRAQFCLSWLAVGAMGAGAEPPPPLTAAPSAGRAPSASGIGSPRMPTGAASASPRLPSASGAAPAPASPRLPSASAAAPSPGRATPQPTSSGAAPPTPSSGRRSPTSSAAGTPPSPGLASPVPSSSGGGAAPSSGRATPSVGGSGRATPSVGGSRLGTPVGAGGRPPVGPGGGGGASRGSTPLAGSSKPGTAASTAR